MRAPRFSISYKFELLKSRHNHLKHLFDSGQTGFSSALGFPSDFFQKILPVGIPLKYLTPNQICMTEECWHHMMIGDCLKEPCYITKFSVGSNLFQVGLCKPEHVFMVILVWPIKNDHLISTYPFVSNKRMSITAGLLFESKLITPCFSPAHGIRKSHLDREIRVPTRREITNFGHSAPVCNRFLQSPTFYFSNISEKSKYVHEVGLPRCIGADGELPVVQIHIDSREIPPVSYF